MKVFCVEYAYKYGTDVFDCATKEEARQLGIVAIEEDIGKDLPLIDKEGNPCYAEDCIEDIWEEDTDEWRAEDPKEWTEEVTAQILKDIHQRTCELRGKIK